MSKTVRRNESQVSRDFSATLKKVVHFSSNSEIKLQSSNSSSKNNIIANDNVKKLSAVSSFNSEKITRFQRLEKSLPLSQESKEWKSLNSVLSERIELNNIQEIIVDRNSKTTVEPLKPDTKENSSKSLKRNNSSAINKNNKKHLIKTFLTSEKFSPPFESTAITDLSFNLTVIVENHANILIPVYNHYTIERVIQKIAKQESMMFNEIALLYNNSRLQCNITLSWYKINQKSKVYLKILEKVKFIGKYLTQDYPIFIYTSEKIIDIKNLFAKEINVDSELIELKYKEIFLHDNKDFSLYDIREGSTINIFRKTLSTSAESPEKISCEKSPGFELSQTFRSMTTKLQKCNCNERRYNALACSLLSHFDSNYEKHNCLLLLSEFGPDYHLKSCFKSTSNRRPSVGKIDEDHCSEISAAEISLNDSIQYEIDRIQRDKKIIIENSDLDYLYQAKNFRAFKRFLKDKIGTKSNLSSVSMLYHYAQSLVMYINPKEKNDEAVNRVLKYINQYFLKYYEKPIIAKGGLTNLTITESNENKEFGKNS